MAIEYDDLWKAFFPELWGHDPEGTDFPDAQPLLAHYTSLDVLEKVITNDEIWFANPAFMNDTEEVVKGLSIGMDAVSKSEELKAACNTPERYTDFIKQFTTHNFIYSDSYLSETYIFCTSEHDVADINGKLSMWRGYGGDGYGAAIVLDTSQLVPDLESPIMISKVAYLTDKERRQQINIQVKRYSKKFAELDLDGDLFYMAAHLLFEKLKILALTTKDVGFAEEQEWRIIYMPERDTKKQYVGMFDYAVTDKAIKPNLKLKLDGSFLPELILNRLVHRIILGPSQSSKIAEDGAKRMLINTGKAELVPHLTSSKTPYRPR